MTQRTPRDCSVNLSASALFYRDLDVVQMMTPEEEAVLAEEMDRVRLDMLMPLMSVPLGRTLFLQPLQRLVLGERVTEDIVDSSYWALENGVLPVGRHIRFRQILTGLESLPVQLSSVQELRLNWHRTESVGNRVFSLIDEYVKLREREEAIVVRAGLSREEITDRSIDFESPGFRADPVTYACWLAYPQIVGIRQEINNLETVSGVPMDELLNAGTLFAAAGKRLDLLFERIVESNIRLVIFVSRNFPTNSVMEEMDLIQEGCRGLLQAARRFDSQRGFKFSTYAVWWIRRFISAAIIRDRTQTGISPKLQRESTSFDRTVMNHIEQNGRYPTTTELADELNLTMDQIEVLRSSSSGQLSMDYMYGEGSGVSLAEYIEADTDPPESAVLREDLRRRVGSSLDMLTERERTIISLRFGLFDGEPQSLESISRVFGVSRERIRQIQIRTVEKLGKLGLLLPAEQEDERG